MISALKSIGVGVGASLVRARARALAAALILLGASAGANAFDFFGLFGSEAPPPVSTTALSYAVTITVTDGDKSLANAVMDASSLYRLRQDPPPDGDSLARRATRDFAPLVDALWGAGYYNSSVVIAIDSASLTIGATDIAAFSRVAESYRNRAVAPVKITILPGPLFQLRSIRILNSIGSASFSADELPAKIIGMKIGDPASASDLRAAQVRIVDYFRSKGMPLAKIQSIAPVVDHSAHVMDVTLTIAPGPVARFGDAMLIGPQHFDPGIVRSFLYVQPGDPYSPQALSDAKTSIREIPAVGGVRITEATKLDASGNLPYRIDIEDRLQHAVGASAKYSTTDGPAAQIYWEDRNLFGGAERLRLQADLFYAPSTGGVPIDLRHFGMNDLGGRVSASFLKPALGGTRNDLLVDALAERVSTNTASFIGYTADDADVTAALRHRFTNPFSIQGGLEAQRGFATDALGKVDYTLIGVPVSALYDSTDNKLDPTRGVRIGASVAGYPMFLGSSLNLAQAKIRGSTYYSLDPDSRFILAGRVGVGALAGPALDEIPANWRFYAGGGGSVRGYQYDTLGPTAPNGAIIGGRSLFEASAELRVKVTDTIGVVPFFDAGNAFASSAPDFSRPLQMAAGLGLRYYTSIGPLRLDVAAPINRRPGDKPVAVYVSIGQSF
jgi:translocation and assembly module TamA